MNKNLTLWNSVFIGYFKGGEFSQVLRVLKDSKEKNIGINGSAFMFSLKSCVELCRVEYGKCVHVDVVKYGLNSDRFVGTALVGFYAACGGMVDARKVFEEVTERDIVAYTSLISGYAKCEDCDSGYEAFDVVKVMVSDGMEPNRVTLVSLLQVIGKLRVSDYGELFHAYAIRRGIGCRDEVFETSFMDMYVKCGAPNKANALNLFSIMAKEGRRFDLIALANVILSCANLDLLRVGKSIHGYMFRSGVQLDVVVKTALVNMYSKCYHQNGHAHDAIEAFRNMRRAGLTENEATILTLVSAFSDLNDIGQRRTSWNTMISASGMHGDCYGALELVHEMKKENIVPDEVTFMSVLSSCSHAGLVDVGLNLFRMMKDEYRLVPSEEHYSCMVDLLGRAGQIDEAFEFLKCIPPTQSGSALVALVSACRLHGNNEMGEALGRWILDFDPKISSSYGLVSNIYAESEKWNDTAQIRASAKQRGLRTTTGCSMIEIDSDGGKSDSGRSDGGRSDYDTDDVIEEGSSTIMVDEVLDVLIRRWDRVHGAKALRLLVLCGATRDADDEDDSEDEIQLIN
ncbi:putative pentatricopeptide repeat-containing protein [Tanacetum coccineum]